MNMIFTYDNDLRYKCVDMIMPKILGWQHLSPFTFRPYTWSRNFFGCFCWTVSSDAEDLVTEESATAACYYFNQRRKKKVAY